MFGKLTRINLLVTLQDRLLDYTSPAKLFSDLARLALAATVVSLPFRYRLVLRKRLIPPIYGDYTDILLFTSDIFLLATLAIWLIYLVLAPRRLSLGPLFLTIPIFAVSGMGVLSSFTSIDPLISVYHSFRLFMLTGLYLYILNEIKSPNILIFPISVQVFIQAIVGVGQALKQRDLGFQMFGEYELDPAWRGVSIVWAEGDRFLRAYGLTDHPNILGGCFAFALILIATWHMTSKPKWYMLTGGIFSLGSLGLFFTFSRAAWMALSAAALFTIVLTLKVRHSQALLRFLGLITSSLVLMTPFLLAYAEIIGVRLNWQGSFNTNPQEIQSLGSRKLLNAKAIDIFAVHPLNGVGLGTFTQALNRAIPDFPIDYQPAHVVLLNIAAETGIFGALFYALSLASPWLALWLNREKIDFSPSLIGVSGLLLTTTLIGLFDHYTWSLPPGRLFQWLTWGLWGVVYKISVRNPDYA